MRSRRCWRFRRLTIGSIAVLAASALSTIQPQTDSGDIYRERLATLEREVREAGSSEKRSEALAALREHVVSEADRLIDDRRYRSKTTEHYRVMTDDPRIDPADAAALLETFHEFFETFWSERLELADQGPRARVYLFYSFFKYNRLLTGEARLGEFRPPGHYGPLVDILVIHTDAGSPGALPGILVHEAAHQLVHRRLQDAGNPDAHWLQEGLASYFGHTRRSSKTGFLEGRIGGKDMTIVDDEQVARVAPERSLLAAAKKLARQKSGWSLEGLVGMRDPEAFYGEGAIERYAASWTLVHALMHGADGAQTAGFIEYLRARGTDPESEEETGTPADLLESLGLTAAELQAAWQMHVLGLKAR